MLSRRQLRRVGWQEGEFDALGHDELVTDAPAGMIENRNNELPVPAPAAWANAARMAPNRSGPTALQMNRITLPVLGWTKPSR